MDSYEDYINRKFGFCQVKWKISNHCLADPKEEQVLYSPNFFVRSYPVFTEWRMQLKRTPSDEMFEYKVSFTLERLDCFTNLELGVDCLLEIFDYNSLEVKEEAFTFSSVPNSKYVLELKHTALNFEYLFHSDYSPIKFQILVYSQNAKEFLRPSADLGIRKLSQDLAELYKSQENFDVILTVGEHAIKAHKALLYYRLVDSSFRDQLTLLNDIKLYKFKYEALKKVIGFLYSANMEDVLKEPRISIFKVAEALEVYAICEYYNPDALTLSTAIDVEEFELEWTIHDFLNRSEKFLVSPFMSNNTLDIQWRLKVYPKGFGGRTSHTGIFVDIETKYPINVCVQIFLRRYGNVADHFANVEQHDGYAKELHYLKHKQVIGREVFGDKDMVKHADFAINFLRNDAVTIHVELRISKHSVSYSTEHSSISVCPSVDIVNYVELCNDMRNVIDDATFHRSFFRVKGNTMSISFHNWILAARCPSLFDVLHKRILNFSFASSSVIIGIMSAIYTGKFHETMLQKDIFKLYDVAKAFNLTIVAYTAICELKMRLSKESSKDIYQFSKTRKLPGLMEASFRYIEQKDPDIF